LRGGVFHGGVWRRWRGVGVRSRLLRVLARLLRALRLPGLGIGGSGQFDLRRRSVGEDGGSGRSGKRRGARYLLGGPAARKGEKPDRKRPSRTKVEQPFYEVLNAFIPLILSPICGSRRLPIRSAGDKPARRGHSDQTSMQEPRFQRVSAGLLSVTHRQFLYFRRFFAPPGHRYFRCPASNGDMNGAGANFSPAFHRNLLIKCVLQREIDESAHGIGGD
jgi:hypothetical protein